MLSFINMDIIGETKAFASCAIFRQKSEVWHTAFFTASFRGPSCSLHAELHDKMQG